MIREYLGAVATAATSKLPKSDRLLFVGRTRAALEARVGPLASVEDADEVAAALTALGDPDDLAAKERERLYSARRRGAAAEPPTLWKPPGKASRRPGPPAKPADGEQADVRPRRARTWPYRRTGPDDHPALPGPAEPGTPAPGTPEALTPEPASTEPASTEPASAESGPAESAAVADGGTGSADAGAGAAAPGRQVHIPQPRRPEDPTGPAAEPGAPTGGPPAGPAAGSGAPTGGPATGPAPARRDAAPGAAPSGGQPGTVGPGMTGRTGWLASSGTVGPGVPKRTAGPGPANGTVGPGAANGTAGPGTAGRTFGPGAAGPAVGPGMRHGTAGSGAKNGTAGSAAPDGAAQHERNGAPVGSPPGAPPGGPPSTATPGGPAVGPDSGPATQPGVAPPDGTRPLSIVPGMEPAGPAEDEPAGRRFGPPVPLTEAWLLARKNPLEAVAVIVLGIGGLLLPFPLWLIGGLIAVFSRKWGKRDKWLALLGPPGFAVICMLLLGLTGGGAFFHALAQASHQFSLLLRVGCLLSAGYLVWRLRRGPRRRKTPPWLRGR